GGGPFSVTPTPGDPGADLGDGSYLFASGSQFIGGKGGTYWVGSTDITYGADGGPGLSMASSASVDAGGSSFYGGGLRTRSDRVSTAGLPEAECGAAAIQARPSRAEP